MEMLNKLEILSASYGNVDCTNEIKRRLGNKNILTINVNNSIIGDTMPGVVKYLTIDYIWCGIKKTISIQENKILHIPVTNNKKLGIFYTNNGDIQDQKVILKSLEILFKIKTDDVDIITSVWYPIHQNPFPEFLSPYKLKTHLNQVLQILQLLYIADSIGDYQTVSFLEHDVLYPEGYFDYPNFNKSEVLNNLNYGGLNKVGWQKLLQKDQPLHQMTMYLDDAILHFNSLLKNAIITNSGCPEPDKNKFKRITWNSNYRPIHINTKRGFTSHWATYECGKEMKQDPYWGDFVDYLDLFTN